MDDTRARHRDAFALMLHDRVVELEAKVARLEPPPLDPALAVLGGATVSGSGAVFVRARSGMHARQGAVVDAVLRRLGRADATRWDVWACGHWSCLLPERPYVLELLVQRSGTARTADVVAVGHAVVDAVREVTGDARHVSVDACAVRSAPWFIESLRAACAADECDACCKAWDPRAGAVVATGAGESGGAQNEAWLRLHGWMAAQLECTDVWHPRAPSAPAYAAALEACVGRMWRTA